MFGLIDWRSLLTERDGIYDVGPFDIRGPRHHVRRWSPRRRHNLGRGEGFEHPVLDLPGWWKRPGRCLARPNFETLPSSSAQARPILITGATGTLGQAFARICAHRGLPHVLTSRADLDICDEASIAAALDRHKPWAVINTAGFVRTWEAAEKAGRMLQGERHGPGTCWPRPASCTAFRWSPSRRTWCSTDSSAASYVEPDDSRTGLRVRPKQG